MKPRPPWPAAVSDAADPGFSTSGDGSPLHNRAGLLGAWASDLALSMFGHSSWWLVLVAGYWLLPLVAGYRRWRRWLVPARTGALVTGY